MSNKVVWRYYSSARKWYYVQFQSIGSDSPAANYVSYLVYYARCSFYSIGYNWFYLCFMDCQCFDGISFFVGGSKRAISKRALSFWPNYYHCTSILASNLLRRQKAERRAVRELLIVFMVCHIGIGLRVLFEIFINLSSVRWNKFLFFWNFEETATVYYYCILFVIW